MMDFVQRTITHFKKEETWCQAVTLPTAPKGPGRHDEDYHELQVLLFDGEPAEGPADVLLKHEELNG